jgi:hypothetical protein
MYLVKMCCLQVPTIIDLCRLTPGLPLGKRSFSFLVLCTSQGLLSLYFRVLRKIKQYLSRTSTLIGRLEYNTTEIKRQGAP